LKSKKSLLVRSFVIENHLAVEEALDDLIRIQILKMNRRAKRKRITPAMADRFFKKFFHDANDFISGATVALRERRFYLKLR
jgi:hypothetical protein